MTKIEDDVMSLRAGSRLTVKVRCFGRLRELLNVKEEEYQVKGGATLKDLLLKHIPERHEKVSKSWREEIFRMARGKIIFKRDGNPVLRDYLVLVKGRPLDLSYELRDEDEIMVLMPVGGG